MKKKGFTLVEIIVVVTLISVLGVGSTITIVKNNEKKELSVLVSNEEKFNNALETYLSTHEEVIDNVNQNVEGAVVSLELLKNEGLVSSDLDIDYKNNYYIVTNSLLSNVTLNDNVIKEECNDSIGLQTISSWAKDNDTNNVLYFCPKKDTAKKCTDYTEDDLTNEVCTNIPFTKKTLAFNIVCNSKKYAAAIDKIDNNTLCNINNKSVCEKLKEDVGGYFYNYTLYDETGVASMKRNDYDYITTAYLSKKEDDVGYSYYYRDNPIDNYVNFAGMCWNIYRIDGDGNVKLILYDKDNECSSASENRSLGNGNFGYKIDRTYTELYVFDYLNPVESKSTAMSTIYKNFQSTLQNNIKNSYGFGKNISTLLVSDWCIDNRYISNYTYDEALRRRKQSLSVKGVAHTKISDKTYTFKCDVEKTNKFSDGTKMYVSGLTVDEVGLGGNVFFYGVNNGFWILNIADTESTNFNPHYEKFQEAYIARATNVGLNNYSAEFYNDRIDENYQIVPVIQLKSGIEITSGVGTKTKPYELNISKETSNIEYISKSSAGKKYIFRGSNPNNYIKYNSGTYRIYYVDTDDTLVLYSPNSFGDTFNTNELKQIKDHSNDTSHNSSNRTRGQYECISSYAYNLGTNVTNEAKICTHDIANTIACTKRGLRKASGKLKIVGYEINGFSWIKDVKINEEKTLSSKYYYSLKDLEDSELGYKIHLNEKFKIQGGSGTSSNPFILKKID